MSGKRTIVIGAGPAGLSCAARLVDHGVPVQVLEASPFVGGLARSFELWGQTVDLGPHRFLAADHEVNALWRRFVGADYVVVERLTRIYFGGRYFNYPLQAANVLRGLGPRDVALCLASYLARRARPLPDPRTFEEWVVNRFGERLFQLFFKTYSEKVWGLPCDRIDADWAAQRIKGLSLWEAARAALVGDSQRRHKTLAERFAYPCQGTGVLYERLRDHVTAGGGEVRCQAPVRQVLLGEDGRARGVELEGGETLEADWVVSSMPLTAMVKSLRGAPPEVLAACDRLSFRNTILVYLEVDHAALFPDNWIYVHAPEVLHGRVTNFRNWSPQLTRGRPTTILCVEYWCFDPDPIWSRADEELNRLAEGELRRIGLLPPAVRVLNARPLRLRRSYPVYETGYAAPLGTIQGWLDRVPNLLPVGRYGAFKYNNQDHSILMGLKAADEVLTGRAQGLWDVNTGSGYLEGAVSDLDGEGAGAS